MVSLPWNVSTGAEVDVSTNDVRAHIDAEKNQLMLEEMRAHLVALRQTSELRRKAEAADLRLLEIQRVLLRHGLDDYVRATHLYRPLRFLFFYDAGQVRNVGEHFAWKEPIYRRTIPGTLYPTFLDTVGIISNPLSGVTLPMVTDIIGETNAFKSSTGAEIRFFMPVLNVPFRLIFAMNPSRVNVLDNNLQPEKKYKFRFAVGSTF
jgi:hypothetical protein